MVKALNAKGLMDATQSQIETMTEYAKSFGAKGLAFIKVEKANGKSPIVKFFQRRRKSRAHAKTCDSKRGRPDFIRRRCFNG